MFRSKVFLFVGLILITMIGCGTSETANNSSKDSAVFTNAIIEPVIIAPKAFVEGHKVYLWCNLRQHADAHPEPAYLQMADVPYEFAPTANLIFFGEDGGVVSEFTDVPLQRDC